MGAPMGPTIRRRRLNIRLKELREEKGLSCEQVAQRLGYHASRVSRIESGRRGVNAGVVRELLSVYQVEGEEAEALVQLARDARRRGWWHPYKDVLTDSVRTYVGLEQDATTISNYEAQFIPGLLQTEAYAREVFVSWRPSLQPEISERLTNVRMIRQRVLQNRTPPMLWAVIDEAALHREVGGRGVMKEQLMHLLDIGERPAVTIQVVPYSVGAYPAMGSGFTLFEFGEGDPPAVYLENLGGGFYLEDPEDIGRCSDSLNYLRGVALSDRESAALIAGIAKAK
ncbi:helix-turn-helix domain-containing protein [Micromonospora sp. C51]|uniref:helix-turn-helix domain-containing protein n=1 Tax=Micromonospora sp. C51 TaxID=2824879 RepID=UPI001B358985|nr:helix-turn-helix transcriptional regulator [Micromonospora sp. C51]MBQ1047807.1 helix-turn-helix domain-containing protein [Micromonospora sp. C51]